jgi:hypothetical protein
LFHGGRDRRRDRSTQQEGVRRTITSKDGLSFEEYLRRRIDAKVRNFNTGLVAPGLVDNLKQDFHDQEADKYRKASRGD